jgi:hypothetical protein
LAGIWGSDIVVSRFPELVGKPRGPRRWRGEVEARRVKSVEWISSRTE